MSWFKGSFIVRGGLYDHPSDMLVGGFRWTGWQLRRCRRSGDLRRRLGRHRSVDVQSWNHRQGRPGPLPFRIVNVVSPNWTRMLSPIRPSARMWSLAVCASMPPTTKGGRRELCFRRREPSGFLPRLVGAALSLQAWNARPDGAMNGCGRPERRRVRPLGRHASRGTLGRERR
jgi:hypothetical protein